MAIKLSDVKINKVAETSQDKGILVQRPVLNVPPAKPVNKYPVRIFTIQPEA